MVEPIKFIDNELRVLDQLLLPQEARVIRVKCSKSCFDVIKKMNVRGAPLIGFTGIYGLAFAALEVSCLKDLKERANFLKSARPTAVNLCFEIDECLNSLDKFLTSYQSNLVFQHCIDFVNEKIKQLDLDNKKTANFVISRLKGLYPSKKKLKVLTICNTGRLACGATGTALGVISKMHNLNMISNVFACETRPYLQGSRLTAYELQSEKINHSLIPDGAVSHVLRNEKIDVVLVGADRIALNGDTANKIGTSNLGIIAKNFGVPLFVVAPLSSFDKFCENGSMIEIEYRDGSELTEINGIRIAPKDSKGYNPSFDVTEACFITGIACERGLFHPSEIRGLL